MRNLSKKFSKTTVAILLGFVIALSASYVSALMSRPANTNTPAPEVIDVSSSDQTIGDPSVPAYGQLTVRKLLAGFIPKSSDDINCPSQEPDRPMDYAYINEYGKMAIGRCVPGSNISLDIKGKTGVLGSIRALRLAHTENAKVPVCASLTGSLELCGENMEYNPTEVSNGVYESGIYSLVIPDGVQSVSVTLRGGGGAGYGNENINSYADDGDPSFFVGTNVSLVANGGQGASYLYNGASGGIVATSDPNGIVSTLISQNGGSGGDPGDDFGIEPTPIKSSICSGATYFILKGGSGGTGGKGGAPYQGSQATAGVGSSGGPTSGSNWNFLSGDPDAGSTYVNCNEALKTSDDKQVAGTENNRIGGNGVNGALSAGGSGFGGQGGASAVDSTQDCSNLNNPAICAGGSGGAGGGAGAYISATVEVNPGEIFYIKVGKGGVSQTSSCTGSYSVSCKKEKAGGGAISGNGGNGQVKIQYDYNS